MNTRTLIIVSAAVAILSLVGLAGSQLLLFINPAGLVLVVGGTLAAAFLAFPSQTMREVWEQLRNLNQARVMDSLQLVELFANLARLHIRQGPRAMDEAAKGTGRQFLIMGVSMVADERSASEVKARLEQEMEFFQSRREAQRAVLNFMGRLAPALGLAGTIIGLVMMLHTLTDPQSVASGMSVALLTTFYGVMLANLVVLPLERKLKEHDRAEAVEMTLIIEGCMGLALEENGAAITARLESFSFARTSARRHEPAPFRGWLKPLSNLATNIRSNGNDA